jgi:hypothetical protein
MGVALAVVLGGGFLIIRGGTEKSDSPVSPAKVASTRTPLVRQDTQSTPESALQQESSDEIDPLNAVYDEWMRKIVAELASRKDANSLLAAALLLPTIRNSGDVKEVRLPRERALQLLKEAAALAPNDPAVQSLTLLICETTPGCDPSAYEKTLRAIDPKNALGWYGEFVRAVDAKDRAATASALANMASAERYDWYWWTRISYVAEAFDSVRVAPPNSIPSPSVPSLRDMATVNAIGVMAAMAMPPFRPLTQTCKSDDAVIAEQCAKIGSVMENGDNFLVQGIGLAVQKIIAAPGSDEALRVAEARRQLDWLLYSTSTLPQPPPAEWIDIMSHARTETEGWREWLKRNDIPLTPPPGWTKPSIQTTD